MVKDKILQLKIWLEGISPKIWRRFFVSNTITFHQLYLIIQTVMGWDNYHLYSFRVGDKEYQDEKSEDFGDFDDEEILSSRKEKMGVLKVKQKFLYTYDFGDDWEHEVIVEKILGPEEGKIYPFCLEGERNCPPEDCGSVSGYYNLMEIRKNKSHPEYKRLIQEWLGEDYDPELFVINWVNARLQGKKPKAA